MVGHQTPAYTCKYNRTSRARLKVLILSCSSFRLHSLHHDSTCGSQSHCKHILLTCRSLWQFNALTLLPYLHSIWGTTSSVAYHVNSNDNFLAVFNNVYTLWYTFNNRPYYLSFGQILTFRLFPFYCSSTDI